MTPIAATTPHTTTPHTTSASGNQHAQQIAAYGYLLHKECGNRPCRGDVVRDGDCQCMNAARAIGSVAETTMPTSRVSPFILDDLQSDEAGVTSEWFI